jgi:O-antigen ligase
MEILLPSFFVAYLLLSLYRIDWAVLVLIAALPAYLLRFHVLGLPSTVLEGMILISFAVWLLTTTNFPSFLKGDYKIRDYLKNRSNRQRYPFGVEIITLLVISFAATIVGGFSLEALGLWRAYFFEPLLVFILVLNLFQHRQGIYKVATALSVSALAVSVFALMQTLTGWLVPPQYWGENVVNRVTSFYSYPNALGLFVAPISLLALAVAVQKIIDIQEVCKRGIDNLAKTQWIVAGVALLTVVLSWSAIWWARSEGAAVGVVVALIVFGFLYNKKTRISLVIVLALSGICIYSYAPAQEYIIEKATLSDLSGEIRKVQWAGAWEMLSDGHTWLFGAGIAGYQEAVAPYRPEGLFFNKNNDPDFRRKIVLFDDKYKAQFWQPLEIYMYPHNIVLNFWAELGVLGVLLFAWIFVKYLYYGFASLSGKDKILSCGLIGALIAIIMHGLVDVPYFKNDLAVQFWVLMAIMSLLYMKSKEKLEIRS